MALTAWWECKKKMVEDEAEGLAAAVVRGVAGRGQGAGGGKSRGKGVGGGERAEVRVLKEKAWWGCRREQQKIQLIVVLVHRRCATSSFISKHVCPGVRYR